MNDNNGENRRIRKIKSRLKELRHAVARIASEIHRRKIRRKLSKKEKEILR